MCLWREIYGSLFNELIVKNVAILINSDEAISSDDERIVKHIIFGVFTWET